MFLNHRYILSSFFYFISIVFVCYFSIQKQFLTILIPAVPAFTGFYFLIKELGDSYKFKELFFLILLLKVSILFSFPHLSDDIYRFWWDGYISVNGFSPFALSPTEMIHQFQNESIYPSLLKYYSLLNSPDYYTAYPLVCQWVFQFTAYFSGDNIHTFNLILKLIFLAADCTLLFFLVRLLNALNIPVGNAILYWGNPLCIIELNGNLHFELFLILFFIISLYFFTKRKSFSSGIMLGFSIVSKLISVLWIPLFIKRPWLSKSNCLLLIGLFIPCVVFLLSLFGYLADYRSGLGLYFKRFEFNSFIYGPVIKLFQQLEWYDSLSKISLALMLIFSMIYLSIVITTWIRNDSGFSHRSAWLILFTYILLGTTVHPWYLTPLLLLSVFTFQCTGFLWSFLVLFSYSRYDTSWSAYAPYMIITEYVLVLTMFANEFSRNRNLIPSDLK